MRIIDRLISFTYFLGTRSKQDDKMNLIELPVNHFTVATDVQADI